MPLPPRNRQACDRCHSQKLRCPKQAGSAVCARCSKASVACVYSPAGPRPTTQDFAILEAPLVAETSALDWEPFSFDQLLTSQPISQLNISLSENTREAQLDPRARCFEQLSAMMLKLNEASNGLPPVSKLHVAASDLNLFCTQVNESYGLRRSLELMLGQTQQLIELYPEAIRLAVAYDAAPECILPNCVHTFKCRTDFGSDPFEAADRPSSVDFTLLNQLISCHYRLHDITELIFSHAQVCFKISVASAEYDGVENHRFDIPELRIGSFTLSPGSSPSVMSAILVDLQSSLARCVPKIQASLEGKAGRECQVLSLQCDMLKERADSIVDRLTKLRAAVIEAGIIT
ncbi:Transcription factor ACEII [Colletotrichum siamense]|uniref:Transcription factor ACEII n=1 Tax=Colletotrichum siamense TaxID=690259 RepID=A0A9P5BP84_COLSI|nr:Transcription factor ACEII [Colletotrichum siamense]KAF4844674.1 Transcription factor ACEII [Colletotrichum siamense]KAF4855014.1 Transcription factor ACEII [Colletotrichum siamense]KAF5491815.1 Transcription factor ACEII [Colletotrichum siamense]